MERLDKNNFSNFDVETNYKKIDFNKYEKDIEIIFNELSKIKGIEYTGASKIMHIRNRYFFVMWDDYIRGEKEKKYYETIKQENAKWWQYKKYKKDAKSYIDFLRNMQDMFSHIDFKEDDKKTFAKAIDEFNYIKITNQIKEMKTKEPKKRKISKPEILNIIRSNTEGKIPGKTIKMLRDQLWNAIKGK